MASPVVKFFKYEGLGNDFIIIYDHGQAEKLSPSPLGGEGLGVRLCDRHRGIGADGIIVVSKSKRPGVVAKMQITNADGSTPEMCGNGFRCVAKFLADEAYIEQGSAGLIETDAGDKAFLLDGENCTVDMGIAEVSPVSDMPDAIAVSMGNPHLVLLMSADEDLAREMGSKLEYHADFPQRVNVEFVTVHSQTEIEVRVWERGVGLTQACGTGACAAVAALARQGLLLVGAPISVRLPGGLLSVTAVCQSNQWRVSMTGPAKRVFVGELPPVLA